MRRLINISPNLNDSFSFQRKEGNKVILWDRFNKHNITTKSKYLNKFYCLKVAFDVTKYDFSTLKMR